MGKISQFGNKHRRMICAFAFLLFWGYTTGCFAQKTGGMDPGVRHYVINTGDVLHLEVFGEPELNMDVTVDAAGFVEYPFAGKVKAAGRTVDDLRQDILERLKDGYFVNPQLLVTVQKYKPVFVQGEVASAGAFDFQPGLTVRKAIALAGGFTERASRKKVYRVKQVDGKETRERVELDAAVFPGDVIEVKQSFF